MSKRSASALALKELLEADVQTGKDELMFLPAVASRVGAEESGERRGSWPRGWPCSGVSKGRASPLHIHLTRADRCLKLCREEGVKGTPSLWDLPGTTEMRLASNGPPPCKRVYVQDGRGRRLCINNLMFVQRDNLLPASHCHDLSGVRRGELGGWKRWRP